METVTPNPPERVVIFDTTLRDGEQSPGASMTLAEKLAVARQLARLRVDVLEAGFPAASPGDLEAVRAIAQEVGTPEGPVITGLARAHPRDLDAAWEGVRHATRARIHTFISTSDLHMERKLGLSRAEVLERTVHAVAHAKALCADVEFSTEDGTRSDPVFLVEILAAAIEHGATTLNIPDTVGYAVPSEYAATIAHLRAATPGADQVVWSVHCHDDLGLAIANSLAGLGAGARQAEVTLNGIGERAGNASLEELVMALAVRQDHFGLSTGIATPELAASSALVAAATGFAVAPNKAIVGANAFAHEAGIHQDGMLKDRRTYEILRPETVGVAGTRLSLGKLSGRHALQARLAELGVILRGDALAAAFERFKHLADRHKVVSDEQLLALAASEVGAEAGAEAPR